MSDETEVLYNETCPVCRFEIDGYRRTAQSQNLPIRFDTLSNAADWGLTTDQAARRLHVRQNGQRLSGIPAFQALWRQMPRWRWLAKLTALPLIHPATCLLYDHILAPILYRAHLRRSR
jgi:predicted DCC family thiol-disulfide oxidoreductase YuxK